MNKENEIERMASIIIKHPLDSHSSAIELSAQGIGDKKQAVKEFAEKLKENAETMIYEVSALPHDDVRYKFSYEAVTVRQIDDLITELYGADE